MKVLVTGASGLIGRHTVELLRGGGYSVRTFQRTLYDGVETVRGDVRTDRAALCAAAADCAAVVHLAGRGDVGESRRDPVGYADLNATGALHALEAARGANAVCVLASSQRVYPLQRTPSHEDDPPAPDSPYGYAKWVAELWCRMSSEQLGVASRVLRFFSVYGPGQQPNGSSGVVSIFARAALAGEPLIVQSAGRRDFTDARDVARGILRAIEDVHTRGGFRFYNVATGVGTTFRELAQAIVEISRSASPVLEDIIEPGGSDLVADVTRAHQELGYTACIPLRDGLKDYVRWLKPNCS